MKTAFVFPGQGSQYVGMGAELAATYPAARAVIDRARALLGDAYVDVFLNGPEEKLKDTRYTQVALFIVSMAAHAVLKGLGARADFTAGHSLGEYSALCAAGAFDFETGLRLVKARGEAIGAAAAKVPGTMAAIVGLDRAVVEGICQNASSHGVCQAVNYNCPGQIVIAGEVAAVEAAVKAAQAAGSPKSIVLNVSGPFHSSLMKPAAEAMAGELAKATLQPPAVPVVMNVDARPATEPGVIRTNLVRQIDHPVLWEDTLKTLFAAGVERFIEVGPGRVLSGLLRRTDKTKKFSNIEDKKSAEAVFAVPAAG
ncbi:MAG: ACP S-malonyltransferase [Elusimicrobia bacterium]|nr:ACP S-malonyltransferase [Elusimicrobiota bacterium]MBK8126647.1 ACP S-malonyltransferase [Elusimicrobiota bacterium]